MRKLSNLKDNVLFVNISSQGLVQFANYLIPLLLIPYVTRVLGPDAFGRASYAQNIGAYLTLLVNYGFEFSATQEVSIHKNNPAKVQSIFSTVIAFKFALFVLSLALVAGLAAVDYRVREDFSSVLIVSLVNFGWVLFPTWFFQGIEHMVKMSVFSFFVKLFGALLVIAMVHRPSDYQLYLLGLTLANVCVGGYSFYYVMHKYGVRLERPQPFGSAQVVRKGFPIFINTILVNCNTMLGIYVMGRYLTDAEIGAYSGAQKIIMAYLKKCILLISIFSLAVSAVTFLLAPLVVSILLGNDFSDAVFLLRLLSPLTFLMTMATTLTVQGLYGMQLQRFAPLIGLAVCVCSVSLNCVLIPKEGAAGSVYAWLVCELVEISIAVGLLWWKKDAK